MGPTQCWVIEAGGALCSIPIVDDEGSFFYFSRASLSEIGSLEKSNMWSFNLWIATFYVGGGLES